MNTIRHTLTPEEAKNGNQTNLPCDDCGFLLVVRENRSTWQRFLSCQKFPMCTGTAEIVLVSEDQQSLFG